MSATTQGYNVVRFVPNTASPAPLTGGGTANNSTTMVTTTTAAITPTFSGGGTVTEPYDVTLTNVNLGPPSSVGLGEKSNAGVGATVPTPAVASGGIAITLEGPFKLSAGIHPDINRAVCSYAEYAKLADPSQPGSLQFFFTNLQSPDVTINDIRIIEVEPLHFGLTPADIGAAPAGAGQVPGRMTEYRLYLSDKRDGFVLPRGGRLRLGLINPSDSGNLADTDIFPLTLTMSELVTECLVAMGLTTGASPVVAPADLDNTIAPQDLKWLGSHAPTELAKLLQRANYALALAPDGNFKLWSIGQGPGPEIPPATRLPQTALKGIDRRGKTVVFTSYPNQIISCYQLPPAGGAMPVDPFGNPVDGTVFDYAYPNADGEWVDIDSSGVFGSNASSAVNTHFVGTSAINQIAAPAMAFKYIQLDSGRFDPNMSPVLRKTYDVPAVDAPPRTLPDLIDIQLLASAAFQNPSTGTWSNAGAQVPFPIVGRQSPNVLVLGQRLGKLNGSSGSVSDFDAAFVPLNFATDISINFSVPKCLHNASNGRLDPQYFHCGFVRTGVGASTIVMLDAESTLDALTDRDTIVVPLPDLQLLEINSSPLNLAPLQAQCLKYAGRYLIDQANPPIELGAVGFFSFAPNGFVSTIEWDQKAVETRMTTLGWFRPGGSYLARDFRTEEHPRESHPHEARTQGHLTSMGAPGGEQPSVPIDYFSPHAGNGTALVPLLINSAATGGGWYKMNLLGTATTPDPTTSLTQAELGNGSGALVYAANPAEVGSTGHYLLSTSSALPQVFYGVPLPPAADGTPCYALVYAEQPVICTTS